MSDTYSAVDASASVAQALDWQDRIDAWPQVQDYKRRTYELLGAERPVLDAGCGTGVDLQALGTGAVGVDASFSMCGRARARGALVAQGAIEALPFPAGAFAGVRADRVLQHVADPEAALYELVRVTRPGGRIVVADPDQESLVLAVPGAPAALVAEVKRLRRDVGYRNGTLAHRLPDLFAGAGLRDVSVETFPLVLTNPDDAFGLPGWVVYWRDRAGFADTDVAAWDAAMQRSREQPGFVYALLFFVVTGCR